MPIEINEKLSLVAMPALMVRSRVYRCTLPLTDFIVRFTTTLSPSIKKWELLIFSQRIKALTGYTDPPHMVEPILIREGALLHEPVYTDFWRHWAVLW